ncbi:hypothetical protein [Mycoplasmopsis primatum]|uniref:hypothetical protein n=1 Tax=Mycoplasmopsis primatum TaxID=55604 RepID=UPI0004983688|nr:hypothetical protein [Mycoplasmopsis primatum]
MENFKNINFNMDEELEQKVEGEKQTENAEWKRMFIPMEWLTKIKTKKEGAVLYAINFPYLYVKNESYALGGASMYAPVKCVKEHNKEGYATISYPAGYEFLMSQNLKNPETNKYEDIKFRVNGDRVSFQTDIYQRLAKFQVKKEVNKDVEKEAEKENEKEVEKETEKVEQKLKSKKSSKLKM